MGNKPIRRLLASLSQQIHMHPPGKYLPPTRLQTSGLLVTAFLAAGSSGHGINPQPSMYIIRRTRPTYGSVPPRGHPIIKNPMIDRNGERSFPITCRNPVYIITVPAASCSDKRKEKSPWGKHAVVSDVPRQLPNYLSPGSCLSFHLILH